MSSIPENIRKKGGGGGVKSNTEVPVVVESSSCVMSIATVTPLRLSLPDFENSPVISQGLHGTRKPVL